MTAKFGPPTLGANTRETKRRNIFDGCASSNQAMRTALCTPESKSWKNSVFSVAYRKFPQKLQGRDTYFDTIMWNVWGGEKVSDSEGGASDLTSNYVMSRMPYVTKAEFKDISFLQAGSRLQRVV